jgi:hypothetical protein
MNVKTVKNSYIVLTADGLDIICDTVKEAIEHKQDLIGSFCFDSNEVKIVCCPSALVDIIEVYAIEIGLMHNYSVDTLAKKLRQHMAGLIDQNKREV